MLSVRGALIGLALAVLASYSPPLAHAVPDGASCGPLGCAALADETDTVQPVTDPGSPDSAGGGTRTCRTVFGHEVRCTTVWGVWSDSFHCYLSPAELAASDPRAAGHDLTKETPYTCTPVDTQFVIASPFSFVFVPNAESPEGPGGVADPRVLAQRALQRVRFEVPDVRTSPRAPGPTLVNLDTWLWIPESQWRTLRASATAGSTTVTVEAVPQRVEWDLGEGTTTCAGPGRPHRGGSSADDEPGCSYRYRTTSDGQPGGAYRISAEIVYQASWSCAGQCSAVGGALPATGAPRGVSSLRVAEATPVLVG